MSPAPGHFAGAGIKDFEGTLTGPAIDSAIGDTYVGTPANVTTKLFNEDNVQISGNAAVTTDPGSGTVSKVHTLAFLDSGKLDLNNNDLIVDYTGASPLSAVFNEIKTGYNHGPWTGTQLTSSAAQAASVSAHQTALGYAEASSLGLNTFDGQSVDNNTIVIRYTYSGDANLDGVVNALDFNAVASNFGQNAGSEVWTQGDFNYDGSVNTLDFTQLAGNFNQVLASPTLGTLVPEPCLIAVMGVLVLSRCRRVAHWASMLYK